MFTSVAPAQVIVSDPIAESSLAELLVELQTAVVSESAVPIVPTGEPVPIASILSYVTQACGVTGAAAAQASLVAADSTYVWPITLPTGDPGGVDSAAICAQIIVYRAQSYNDTVYEVWRLQAYIALLEALSVKGYASITNGLSVSTTAQATTILADVQVEMAYWRTRKEAFDTAIKYLQEEQNTLHQTALKGGGLVASLLGGAIQIAALQAALIAVHP